MIATSNPTLSDYSGVSIDTGAVIAGEAHLMQSIRDILMTPIGSRVMRRTYGSRLPELLDAPVGAGLVADIVASTAEAVAEWEPRVTVKQVLVNASTPGALTMDLVVDLNGQVLRLEGVL